MSYKLKEVTKGSVFKSKDMGCPIPPPAPRTATFRSARAEEENARRARVRAAVDRANIFGEVWVVRGEEGEQLQVNRNTLIVVA
jgi:hypothetical protein